MTIEQIKEFEEGRSLWIEYERVNGYAPSFGLEVKRWKKLDLMSCFMSFGSVTTKQLN